MLFVTTNNTFLDEYDKKLSVRSILKMHWDSYSSKYQIPDYIQNEVTKCLNCHSPDNGGYVYYCPKCNEIHFITFGCNSRLCSNCGKRYADQWAHNLSKSMFPVPHRHFVYSVPDALWSYLYADVSRWKVYMDAVIAALTDYFSHLFHNPRIKPAIIVVLHPFGKDLKFQPHLHVILAEGGFLPNGKFIHRYFYPADGVRKNWQCHVLKKFQEHGLPNHVATEMYNKYPKGFYVWVHRNGRIKNPRKIGKYLCRYVRHPAIANSRIDYFDDKIVKFHYYEETIENGKVVEKRRVNVVKSIDDFITALIQHIPTPQFKMIRYYGCYSRRSKKHYGLSLHSSIKQKKLYHFGLEKQHKPVLCPKCGTPMDFVLYSSVPPPKNVKLTPGNINYWINLSIEKQKLKLRISQRS